ncbi:MAG: hypothetical protein LBS35_10075, partial [Synergistaceae bacterium]|nr:hypothetical protein [Synergistaceae bacterium]
MKSSKVMAVIMCVVFVLMAVVGLAAQIRIGEAAEGLAVVKGGGKGRELSSLTVGFAQMENNISW